LSYKFKEGSRVKVLGPVTVVKKNLLFEGLERSRELPNSLPKVLSPGGSILINEFEEELVPGAKGTGLHMAGLPGMVVGIKTHQFTVNELERLNAKRAKRKELKGVDLREWLESNPDKKLPHEPLTEESIRLDEPKYAVLFEDGKAMWMNESQLEGSDDTSGTETAQRRSDEARITSKALKGSSTTEKPSLFEVFKITKDVTTKGPTGFKSGDLHMVLTMRIKSQKGIHEVVDYLRETLEKHNKVDRVLDEMEPQGDGGERMFFVTKEGDVQSFIIKPRWTPTEMFREGADRKLHPIKGPRTIVLK